MSKEIRKLKLAELGRVSLEAFKNQPKIPIVLVLDNIRSAMNVGSLFRTGDAFALERIILSGITAQPPHKEILKTAIGATSSVQWEYIDDVEIAANRLRNEGYRLIGIEQTTRSVPLSSVKVDQQEQYAIFLGNEVDGLSGTLLPILDQSIEIAQYGTKHSLNVAVCGGIVLWHYAQAYHLP